MDDPSAPPPSNSTITPPAPPPSNSTITPPAPPPSNSTITPPAPPPSNSTITPPAPPPSNSTITPTAPPPSNSTTPPSPPPKISPASPPPSNATSPPPETQSPPPQPSPATPPRTPTAPPPLNSTTPPSQPMPPVTPPPANDTMPSPRNPPPPPESPSETPPTIPRPSPPAPSPPAPPTIPRPSPPAPPTIPHPSPPAPPSPEGESPVPSFTPPDSPGQPSRPSPRVSPSSDSGSSSIQTPVIIGIVVGGVVLVAILALIFVFYYRKKKRRYDDDRYYAPPPPPRPKNDNNGGQAYHWQQAVPQGADNVYAGPPQPSPPPPNGLKPPPGQMRHQMPPPPPAPYLNSSSGGSGSNYSGPENPARPLQPGIAMGFSKSVFTYEELALATDGFSEANLLGEGGFGYVHKGVLPSGKEVAIKSLKDGSGQGEREFQAEVEIISRVHHKHLVTLVGYCMAGSQRMLVYEFVPNNTMEFHLHGRGRPPMDWAARVKIAIGSAKGLAYLHEDCQPKIIHRDIKAANILLDFKFEAKVADFGLAKFTSDMNTHVSTRVMGTFGYLAPEYASSGKLTEKSDIYSFGVMLLELITGKRPFNATPSYMEDSLIDWARPLLTRTLEDGNFDALVDPNLQNQYNHDQMAWMVACAAACVRHSARRRPRMSQVVRTLEGDASLSDLNDGLTPGHSSAYSVGSSDYDTNQYKDDMKKFRKQIMGTQEHGPSSEYSGQTSDYGLNPSGSSSEGQYTREMEMRKVKNGRKGLKESSQE